jgi:iron(III) transport system substrate-binding protein
MPLRQDSLHGGFLAALLVAATMTNGVTSARAETPPSAQKLIAQYKLGPDVTADWEAEEVLPPAWTEAAKKEPKLRINGSWEPQVFRAMTKSFSERYPFITINYSRGTTDSRVQQPIIAFHEGRYVIDMVTGIESWLGDFRKLNALEDLSDIPNLKLIPEHLKSSSNDWVGMRMRYWCMAYNPNLIGKDQMPKTWDDLLTTKELYGGHLALWNGVSNWLVPLWSVKGQQWSEAYLQKLFSDVQPQPRKEGAIALVKLVIAGEFKASLAAAEYMVQNSLDKGAPIAFHCPNPVPGASSSISVIKGNPAINSSKIFVNWLISKEGQVAQFAADGSPPVHPGLQNQGFMPFPEELAGKTIALRDVDRMEDDTKAIQKLLKPYGDVAH